MRHHLRRWTPVLALLLLIPFSGCRWAEFVTVEITDFDSSEIEGIWMWHDPDGDGEFERSSELVILDRVAAGDREYINYDIIDADGDVRYSLPAELQRDPQNPDGARISVMVVLFDGDGFFRASTYNAAGESPLSAQVIEIDRS